MEPFDTNPQRKSPAQNGVSVARYRLGEALTVIEAIGLPQAT